MKLTNWFLNFDFSGRARRSHYWANVAAWAAIDAGVIAVGMATQGDHSGGGAGLGSLLLIVALLLQTIDGLAMVFRRAHDTGKTGWIWVLLLIPIVFLLPLYWLLIEDSQQGPNKYGPPVKDFYTTSPAAI